MESPTLKRVVLAAIFVSGAILGGLAYRGIRSAREAATRNSCRNTLRMIGGALEGYSRKYNGALPPAMITDGHGTPTHSWRTLISPYGIYYDRPWLAQLDLSQPWDAPVNKAVLDSNVGTVQCPAHENAKTAVTQYVAVSGPGTLWPPPTSADDYAAQANQGAALPPPLDGPLPRILLVDWPASDILWTEPRDLTVDEFLAWFQQQRANPTTHGGGAVLYLGEDLKPHDLPLDTPLNTVRQLLSVDAAAAAD
ncbi:MAG: hypothetical protein CMJ58_06950 [Planctomycetaceae bacterium]|nr:hypothetical protein [Planctomycetaceae bacterium]